MLKVKDDVDLKELEKFGFYKSLEIYQKNLIVEWNKGIPIGNIKSSVYIRTSDRIIRLTNHFEAIENTKLDVLYDLVQAGFVEKIEE